MSKRGHRRRPKRTRPALPRQDKELARKARELYRPDDGEWSAELDPLPSPGRVTLDAAPAAELVEPAAAGEMREGTVVELFSGACRVEEEGHRVDCALPSRLAREQRSTLAVGDEVRFVFRDGGHRIVEVLPRRTVLARPDPHNPRRQRVIAANVDVVVQVSSLVRPPLRPALVDRYLIVIERGGAQPLLVVNKIDLVPAAELEAHLVPLAVHREAGLGVLPCSTADGRGLDALRAALAGKTAVFVGHSGVGKSSLLNALAPTLEVTTGEVSQRHSRGRHTTTRSHLYHLGAGIRVIDTPGIRELGLGRLEPRELGLSFPDFDEAAAACRFRDCTHTHEPDCGVKAAVAAGRIPERRLRTYERILASLAEDEAG